MTPEEQTEAIKRAAEKIMARIGATAVRSVRHSEGFVQVTATMPEGRLITVQIQEGPA